jgi:site-specific DNA-methyltransferase (adenine-specific)/adenine-specific DNA-methyltransferase
VPYSIINELYNKRDFSKIRQPVAEEDVNDTVDAVGFDFIRPPVIEYELVKQKDTIDLKLTKFVSKTISKKPIILENLESLSMCIIDYDYSGEYIDFERLLYADEIKKSDYTISLDKDLLDKPCMIIWIDIF